jgi:putative tricarboxylic transport membrane protein
MVNGPTWKSELQKKDWLDYYLPGAQFGAFLDAELTRVTSVLKDLGLAA